MVMKVADRRQRVARGMKLMRNRTKGMRLSAIRKDPVARPIVLGLFNTY
jgi:hypothetical protein